MEYAVVDTEHMLMVIERYTCTSELVILLILEILLNAGLIQYH